MHVQARRSSVRWWPLVLIVAGAAGALAVIWSSEHDDRQKAYLTSAAVVAGAGLLAFGWLVLISRLPRRLRVALALGAAGVAGALAASVRVRGVTGDLVPILEWRWNAAADAEPAGAPRATGRPAAPEPSTTPLEGLADFPQFLGPARNGVLAGPRLARDWKAAPPELLWRRPVGAGWSGFAVAGRRAVTLEQRGEKEVVACYDVASGAELWTSGHRARYFTTLGGLGPRTTPTIAGRRVVALGATGILECVDLRTGARIWSHHILEEHAAPLPEWGVAGSPLVHEGRVVVAAGGPGGRSLVAYDLATGSFLGGGGDAPAHYASPARATLAGHPQVLIFHALGVSGHDEDTLAELWRHPWKRGHPHVCQPVAVGADRLLVSSGYGTGAELVRVTRSSGGSWTTETLWRSRHLKAKFTNLVVRDGFVYGLDDGILACVDLRTGRRRWKRGRYGHGQVLLVGDLLLVMAERGEVVLVEANPERHIEAGRIPVFERKTWNPPCLAGRYLLVRNDHEAACYRLAVDGE